MLTQITVRNFKRFKNVQIELGDVVVLIGPNNSGKTTALQALALWEIGLRKWNEKRKMKKTPEKRPGVTINRRDVLAVPIPGANLLWRDLHVRDVRKTNGGQETKNVRIDITVEGITNDRQWKCGFEFDYANNESFYCRPLRDSEGKNPRRMEVPDVAAEVRIAFLPPMSGLAANETKLDEGAVNVRLGEGRTAEVLRNLCYRLKEKDVDAWKKTVDRIKKLFGVTLQEPRYIAERGEITMMYRSSSNVSLDLSCAGRGLQQTLLLLAHLEANPNSVLLLDEPDAHLEILRQRQIYELLTTAARERGCQLIAASHSEVILNEAADRDVVVAFVGPPHRIDDRGHQTAKSLKQIGFEQYYLAEQTGWVLYLEGATGLAILKAFADVLSHPAARDLDRPFWHYIENLPHRAKDHFHAIKEAKPDLVGFVLCDRVGSMPKPSPGLGQHMWQRREIENYLCQPETLLAYASAQGCDEIGPLFAGPESERHRAAMEESINDNVIPAALKNRDDPWWVNVKASDEFLDRVFEAYLKRLELPIGLMRKSDYHRLAPFVPAAEIAPEVRDVLDMIHTVSKQSQRPMPEDE